MKIRHTYFSNSDHLEALKDKKIEAVIHIEIPFRRRALGRSIPKWIADNNITGTVLFKIQTGLNQDAVVPLIHEVLDALKAQDITDIEPHVMFGFSKAEMQTTKKQTRRKNFSRPR